MLKRPYTGKMHEQLKSGERENEKDILQEAELKKSKRGHIAQGQLRKYLERRSSALQIKEGSQLKAKNEPRIITPQIRVQTINNEDLTHKPKEQLEVSPQIEQINERSVPEKKPIDFANLPKTAVIHPPESQKEDKKEPIEPNIQLRSKKDFVTEITSTSTLIGRRKQLLMRYKLI